MSHLRLKDIREDSDKDQKEIAEVLNISQQYYSRYELGQVELPIRHYKKLAEYYNVSIDYLAGLIDEPRPLYEGGTKPHSRKSEIISAYSNNPTFKAIADILIK
ncbi:MAG: helix-turn-helix transcriptional regulator [Clostridia bacterium]|nr:helix-turn-helix transcriptional regulator [Clostridia bacterium]MBQ8290743.1 helix-turn-helix transcriptional regulator [Clostridia bacterium]